MPLAIDEEEERKNKASPFVLDAGSSSEDLPMDPTPATHAATSSPPPRQSLVSAYLASKKAPNSPEVDPGLASAQAADRTSGMVSGISRGLGNVANTAARGASAFANAIAGHGYSSSAPDVVEATPADEKPASAVKTYLAAKASKEKDSQAESGALKNLAEADKNETMAASISEPNGLKAREVTVKEAESKRKYSKDAVVGGQKDRSLDQGDKHLDIQEGGLELAKVKEDDLQGFREYQKHIGWSKLDAQQKGQALGWYKAHQSDTKISQRQEALDRDETDRTVAGSDGSTSKGMAKTLTEMKGNTSAALTQLEELKKLRSELTFNGALPTDAEAKFEAAYNALSPTLNGAEFKTAWTEAHGENFKTQLRNSTDLRNWLNSDYFDNQADEVGKALKNSYTNKAAAAGVPVRSQDTRTDNNRSADKAHGVGMASGRRVTSAGLSEKDQAAVNWARDNKEDPRAAIILKAHGLQ